MWKSCQASPVSVNPILNVGLHPSAGLCGDPCGTVQKSAVASEDEGGVVVVLKEMSESVSRAKKNRDS